MRCRFLSNANVSGQTRRTDSTHATVTLTQIKATLQLNITIWMPPDVTPHVIEHEEGHRQISEYYYQTAEKIAERVAATYMGKQVEIAGADLDAESIKALQQMAAEINRGIRPGIKHGTDATPLRHLTDHSAMRSSAGCRR